MKDKDGWENAAPRKNKKWDLAWFLVRWGNDPEQSLLIWPTGGGGCSWMYGMDAGDTALDDPEYLSRETIKDERIFFNGPIKTLPHGYTDADLTRPR